MLANRSNDEIALVRRIKGISQRTRVRFCNEFEVFNNKTLGLEFGKFGQYTFQDYLFVAIVVKDFPDHEYVIEKYNVQDTRGSGMFLHGKRIWIWDVTIDGTNFVVFGPHDFAKISFGTTITNQDVLEKFISEAKGEGHRDDPVFKVHVPERRVHQIQDHPLENLQQYQRRTRVVGEEELGFRDAFLERFQGHAWTDDEVLYHMERDYALWKHCLKRNMDWDRDQDNGIWQVLTVPD